MVSVKVTRFRLSALLAAAALAAAPSARAQSTGGTVSGTLRDGSGAVLPGVTVVVTNTDTARARTVVTDGGGRYVAPDLQPGPYSVTATLEGFNSVVRAGITLTVGREAVVDLELPLGKISDQVTVVGEARTVDTRSASTGGLITTGQIEGLP
ncbi:MAG TPA: carboxypeptidase-like regulatory domain-containing protein, partial [Vicinamibacterales bacterium]